MYSDGTVSRGGEGPLDWGVELGVGVGVGGSFFRQAPPGQLIIVLCFRTPLHPLWVLSPTHLRTFSWVPEDRPK